MRSFAVLSPSTSGADIASLRTADSDTYAATGGGYTTRVFQSPINFLSAAGVWEPINDLLEPDPSAGAGAVSNVADQYQVVLPGSLTGGQVRVSYGSASVGFSAQGATAVKASIVNNEATYANAYRDTTLRYEAVATGVKESIVLRSAHAPTRFVFPLSVSRGLTPRIASWGGVEFVHADGKLSGLRIAPATISARSGVPLTKDVSMRLAHVKGRWELVVHVNRRWLDAAGRRFPVTVDPTVTSQTYQSDCWIASAAAYANTSLCADGFMDLGYTASTGYARMILGFQLPTTIPTDAVVGQATMSVDFSAGTAMPNAYLYSLSRTGSTSAATWNKYDGTHAWTTPGGDYQSVPYDSETIPSSAGYVNWAISSLVQNWVSNPSAPRGMEIIDDNGGALRGAYNNLSNAQSSNDWPSLTFNWYPRLGAPAGSPNLQIPTSDAASMSVNVADGNLELSTPSMSIDAPRLPFSVGTDYDSLGNSANPTAGGATGYGFDFTPGPGMELYTYFTGTPYGPTVSYLMQTEDGLIRTYSYSGQTFNGYSAYTTPGLDSWLYYNGTNYVLYLPQELKTYQFNSSGLLVSQSDNNADQISYSWGPTCTPTSGRYAGVALPELTSMTDSQGRTITPSYNTAYCQVSGWSDSTGRNVVYAINNTTDELTSWTDPAGRQTQYGYDAAGDVNQITDPDGDITTMTYNSAHQVTQIQQDPGDSTLKRTWTFAYQSPVAACQAPSAVPSTSVDPLAASSETVVTDPNGAATTYCTDTSDRTVATLDPSDQNIAYYTGYDSLNDPTGTTELSNTNQSPATIVGGGSATYGTAKAGASGASLPSSDPTSATTTNDNGFSLSNGTQAFSNSGQYQAYVPSASTDSQGNTTQYTYNTVGDETSLTDALSSQNELQFNYENLTGYPQNLLQNSIDADGNQTGYSYYTNGNLQTITPPAPQGSTTYTYDGLSRVHTSTDADGNVTTYTYNADGQTTNTAYSDGTNVADVYDSDGNLLTETGPGGTETNTYNALGQLTQTVTPTGQTIGYSYDHDGNLASLTDGAGAAIYTYNDLDQLATLQQPDGHLVHFNYDAEGNRTQTVFINNVAAENWSYNAAGQPTTMITQGASGNVDGFNYSYAHGSTNTGLLQSQTTLAGPFNPDLWSYTYDALNRVTEEKITNGSAVGYDQQYTYDGNGNPITSTLNGGTPQTSAYNADNELCWTVTGTSSNSCGSPPSGATVPSYDAHGNETNTGSTSLTYDAADQTKTIGGNPMTFFGTGQTNQTLSSTSTLVNSQLGLDSIITSSGTDYIIRDNTGAPIGEQTPSGDYYFVTATNGSVLDTINSSGNAARDNAYCTYGQQCYSVGSGPNDLGFDGTYNSQPNGLDHYGARLLDPTTTRWTQPDPLAAALASDPTQADAYGYAGDDPINDTDLAGTTRTVPTLGDGGGPAPGGTGGGPSGSSSFNGITTVIAAAALKQFLIRSTKALAEKYGPGAVARCIQEVVTSFQDGISLDKIGAAQAVANCLKGIGSG